MAKRIKLRALLREKQGNKCCYCELAMVPYKQVKYRRPNPRSETIEHLRRRDDGGTNRPDNLALACLHCNNKRGSTDWLTYKSRRMGELAF